jgi:hypothetical protein
LRWRRFADIVTGVPNRPAPSVRLAVALAAALLAAPAAAADPLEPGGLGAATGALSGNDGVWTNPASVAARRRYSAETMLATERRGGRTTGQYLVASVVDVLTSTVATSLVYARPLKGNQSGNYFLGGLAGPLSDKFYLGAQARYVAIKQTADDATVTKLDVVTADAGLFWEVADYLSVGFSGFNLIPTGHATILPRNVGGGLSVGSDTSAKVVADWRADLDRAGKTTNRYGVGTEILLGRLVPVRAGWQRDEALGTSWWSAGVGLVTANGVGLDVGYKQSIKSPEARVIAVALRMQFLEL